MEMTSILQQEDKEIKVEVVRRIPRRPTKRYTVAAEAKFAWFLAVLMLAKKRSLSGPRGELFLLTARLYWLLDILHLQPLLTLPSFTVY